MTQHGSARGKKGPVRINLFIGGPPPPGALVFMPDGTIQRTPDTPEVRHEWTIRKMTAKIAEEPEDAEWYYERGMAEFALGRYEEAIRDFSKVIELIPGWGEYHRIRGLCFYHANRRAEALEDLRKYRELTESSRLHPEAIAILEELENVRPE